jgi:hypothetical protein
LWAAIVLAGSIRLTGAPDWGLATYGLMLPLLFAGPAAAGLVDALKIRLVIRKDSDVPTDNG